MSERKEETVFSRIPFISIDPGLKNMGVAVGNLDQVSDSHIVIRVRKSSVGVLPFIDGADVSDRRRLYQRTLFFFNAMVGGANGRKFDNGIAVVEKQYFNPRAPASMLGHQLCLIETALVTYIRADRQLGAGSVVLTPDPRMVKKEMLGSARLARNKKKEKTIDIVTSLLRDNEQHMVHAHRINEHVADCFLNLIYVSMQMNASNEKNKFDSLDNYSIEFFEDNAPLPLVVQKLSRAPEGAVEPEPEPTAEREVQVTEELHTE